MSSYKKPTPLQPLTLTSNNSQFKSAYSIKERVRLTFPQQSRWTKQSFKDECDINILMSRYKATGQLPNLNERLPQYIDATGFEYQQAMEIVAQANTLFEELPSAVRNRFANNPAAFLDFTSDPANAQELHDLGLLREGATIHLPTSSLKNQTQPVQAISTREEPNRRTTDQNARSGDAPRPSGGDHGPKNPS